MVRAALYARYSSDQQRICRERAEREGWAIVDSYADQASLLVYAHRSR